MYTKAQMPAMVARRQARLLHNRFYLGSQHSCGGCLRYTSTANCVDCTKERSRDRYIPIASQRGVDVPS
jgi:hypothetical protein